MSNLVNYLNTLDKDAAAREAHNADPEGAMAAFGLLDHEQQAVLSGDPAAMASAAGIDAAAMPTTQITNGEFNKPE
jgi:hypothetical protein